MSLRTPKRPTSSTSTSTPLNDSVLESRKRQSKRDEAIRKRVENDLNKKRFPKNSAVSKRRSKSYQPGSVLSLKPSDAVVCKPSFTAYEAAQLMGAKRENCILVVNEDDYDGGEAGQRLLGIFTAKDLAFRVVGKGLNAGSVTIDQIMTPNPLCATSDTLASEALNLMVQKGFRHLPIVDSENNGSIVGVLDITKCYQEAMEKLERMYESSKKLHDALEGVQFEIGIQQQPLQVIKYFESLKTVMNGPTLETVLDENTLPSYINVKTSVYDAAILMKENHTTAVLVKDSHDEEVTGIFTSKDVVLRVIAAGLDPKTVSVIRVMTSQPDVAPKNLTIQAALRKMFDGHYLNLPIVEDDEIIGIVEVLKLTYATLNQISLMKLTDGDEGESNAEGPAWNKFWTSLDNHTDTESIHSDSINQIPDISQNEINQFSLHPSSITTHSIPNDFLKPSDSISVTNEAVQHTSNGVLSPSQFSTSLEFKEVPFAFKFKSPKGRVHRISIKPIEGFTKLRELIISKLNKVELDQLDENIFAISYIDDEEDIVAITTDQDLIDCVLINKNSSNDKADLFIHHPDSTLDLDEYNLKKKNHHSNRQSEKSNIGSNGRNELIPGVPNEAIIGGSLAILGVSIFIAFTLGKK